MINHAEYTGVPPVAWGIAALVAVLLFQVVFNIYLVPRWRKAAQRRHALRAVLRAAAQLDDFGRPVTR